MTLQQLIADAAEGVLPPPDGSVTVLPQPSARDAGVLAFTAHTVVFADADPGRVRELLPPGDLSAPLNPPFLTALGGLLGRRVNGIDLLATAAALPGPPPGPPLALRETAGREHPRAARALAHRDEVRVWTVPGGTVLIGRGVAGRWEMAVEVEPAARGAGLGRRLALEARRLVPDGGTLWAQIAPGNAASVRALLAAGFTPIGAEALLVPAHD
ncbi:GNAT family N-acetyltransferase [Streptomyces sp. NPDC088354]|uniref:GNAT family N-acetyltransferase n=1 Tax=unclassified Streptomyces TaxID=2593676 RepID=UPI0029A716AF|nr:GNAT family N-acetyltransferase [Streptomyces sp. MI02-7b]MDX3073897.1 GNAT family N-acetyltransferase [Streptomyces sp. MI02-7b]